MDANRKIFVAGPASAARQAIVRRLKIAGLSSAQIDTWEDYELDLCDQAVMRSYLQEARPDQIYIVAGPWGRAQGGQGRHGRYMADALLGPVQLIHEALYAGVPKLLFVASHQVYGGCTVLPLAEEDLAYAVPDTLRAPLAVAHTTGIRVCEAYTREFGHSLGLSYRSVVVGHVYGPGGGLDPSTAGEPLALMRHIHQAKVFKLSSVNIRANGLERGDWLYVDDMADGCIGVLELSDSRYRRLTQASRPQLNLGSGKGCTYLELVQAVARVVGYEGQIQIDGQTVERGEDFFLDTHRVRSVGWQPRVGLDAGLAHMYRDYQQQERKLASTP